MIYLPLNPLPEPATLAAMDKREKSRLKSNTCVCTYM